MSLGYSRQSDETVKVILAQLKQNISFTDIAKNTNVTTQTVINYFKKYVDCKRKPLPEVLSIDEFKNLSYGKGKYACLLLDYQTGEIVDVLPNRRLDYLQFYFNKIPIEEKENVKFLISDMYDGYKHLHEYVFHDSTFVIDAFHYIRYITEAFNKVRIRVMKSFSKTSKEYKLLKRYGRLLSKDSNKIHEETKTWPLINKEMSTSIFINYLKTIHIDLATAYDLKEEYFHSYKRKTFDQAEDFLTYYINKMEVSCIPEFNDVASTFTNWKEHIVNSFNKDEYGKRMSNGRIEGTNGKIKAIKKISFGYDNFYHFRNRIMYIINEDEKPLEFPKKDVDLEKDISLYIHKRGVYTKGFIHSKDQRSNGYGIVNKEYASHPLMTDKEAISYIKSKGLSKDELSELNSWIRERNSFYSNPVNAVDENGEVLDFIQYIQTRNKNK
ncbi:MAG: ISL3 family transposase [Bacilli bacterium]|nr:ISL3 family transposase [Bacillales bacterium]MDY2746100.1 ISL3 family transposase [Bacilli bacterium]MDY3889943.1 ISL3 family transposase [Bacilli bacterium]